MAVKGTTFWTPKPVASCWGGYFFDCLVVPVLEVDFDDFCLLGLDSKLVRKH